MRDDPFKDQMITEDTATKQKTIRSKNTISEKDRRNPVET